MLKKTFGRENCFQFTNTTKVSASKPTQKKFIETFLFSCSQYLYKFWEFAFNRHIRKTKLKVINFLIAFYWECYKLFFGNKIDQIAF